MRQHNLFEEYLGRLALAGVLSIGVLAAKADDDQLTLSPEDDDLPTMKTFAQSKQEEAEKLRGSSEPDYTSIHSVWCTWYQSRWALVPHDSLEPAPQAKLDEISDKYIAQWEEKVRKNDASKSPAAEPHLRLGEALHFRQRWEAARAEFEKALKLTPDLNSPFGAETLYRLAETYFGEKNHELAQATLRRLLALKLPPLGRGAINWRRLAQDALAYLTDEDLNTYGMPCGTDFRPFPEPQQAEYTETFAPCAEIALTLNGVKADDARVRLLTKKLAWRGFKWTLGGKGYPLAIALDSAAPVEKKEGYTLEVTERGASIRARDLRGILWGIVSFLQVADPVRHAVRVCKVNDWPDCPRRGYLGTFWSGCTEFTVFNKMTTVVHQSHPLTDGADSPLNVYQCEQMGREFKELGLEVQYGIVTWTMNMAWPYAWKSFLGMQIEIGKKIAAMGAGVYYPNDDCRYMPDVLKPIDLEGGKKPSDYDAQHILDFYNAIKRDYPDFIMTYCPPWYWGPHGSYPYDDDRDKYLRSLRILPPEVSIIWTGERVKSYKKRPESVAWVSGLTHHKPLLFQNATGPHERLSYVMDRTDWNGWHYPGFFENDIDGYLKNATTPTECPQITSLADCLWNVKGYEPNRGILRGMANYAGTNTVAAFESAYHDLCHIDRYRYGAITPLVRDENLKDVERKFANIERATAEVARLKGQEFLNSCAAWTRAVEWFRGLVAAVKNPPDFRQCYAGPLSRVSQMAMAQGWDRKQGDILLDALDFHGADIKIFPPSTKSNPRPKNQVLCVEVWDGCTARAKMNCTASGGDGFARAFVRSQFDGACNGPNPTWQFVLRINGKSVYDGKTPSARQEIKIPISAFKKGENTVEIFNGVQDPLLRVSSVLFLFPKAEKALEDMIDGDDLSLEE